MPALARIARYLDELPHVAIFSRGESGLVEIAATCWHGNLTLESQTSICEFLDELLLLHATGSRGGIGHPDLLPCACRGNEVEKTFTFASVAVFPVLQDRATIQYLLDAILAYAPLTYVDILFSDPEIEFAESLVFPA